MATIELLSPKQKQKQIQIQVKANEILKRVNYEASELSTEFT